MALRNIVTEGDSVLTKVSRPVTKFDRRLHVLLDDMTDTLVDAGGVGLAAPQVGVLRRAVVVDTGEDGILELINPEIIEESGEQTGLEGCLSVPANTASSPGPTMSRSGLRTGTATGSRRRARSSLPGASATSWPIWRGSSIRPWRSGC